MEERREYTRVSAAFAVRHRPAKCVFESTSTCQNISLGGICFPALQRLEPKLKVGLSIDLPGFKDPITARAEVMWLREIDDYNHRFLVGARFLAIDPTDRSKILHYICNKSEEVASLS